MKHNAILFIELEPEEPECRVPIPPPAKKQVRFQGSPAATGVGIGGLLGDFTGGVEGIGGCDDRGERRTMTSPLRMPLRRATQLNPLVFLHYYPFIRPIAERENDGDLKSKEVPTSFGFDTVCKQYILQVCH